MMEHPKNKRVVITGVGVISPIGIGKEDFWQALTSGKCGIGDIESFDTSGFKVHRGYEVKDFRFSDFFDDFGKYKMGKAAQFGAAAVKMALKDAAIDLDDIDPERIGISVGSGTGEIQILENICRLLSEGFDETKINRTLFSQFPCSAISESLLTLFQIRGPSLFNSNSCAAGNYAVGYAYDTIRFGRADIMVAGGGDPISKAAFTGFCRLNAIDPVVCRPFDNHRKGLVLGEGAGVMILESLESAVSRNARVYGEIAGYGTCCDTYHFTAPEPNGQAMMSGMRQALAAARIAPEDVDYINAHGTGTLSNDKIETLAIRKLFNNHADKLLVSSIKSMIGHAMGAASSMETITCALAVSRDTIPPTINSESADPECDLNYVPNEKIAAEINIAMNNSFAFGGNIFCVVVKKYKNGSTHVTEGK